MLKGFGGCFYPRKNRECPFIICEKKKGYFTCSAACHRFKAFSICSHVVAVAHSLGKLAGNKICECQEQKDKCFEDMQPRQRNVSR